ncbi:DUF421 domain-containing protein [Lederbergia galactosidilytica]|uniref:Membrane protein n=1 Tax=Lederbergia galactosidilytica TaxID=217031 RepID=A0A177ZWG2_9BACI|nr:DUF421 domain-containing protein [Lederbergia galactosidilytica]KRG09478.1 membrane protein [Virgibacillus soli]OAK72257.1 membrane protein [Lederbergia galactosidilytica]
MVIILFLLTKWLGKKQLSHLSFFEYIVGITIGSIAAEISTGLETNYMNGVYSLLIWTIIPFVAGIIGLKSKKVRNFIEGSSTVVIKDGKIQEENLSKEQYTVDELLQLLRKKNAFQIADVEFAILESNGDLNVMLKKDKQPITPADLQLEVAPEKVPQTVIMEGKIIDIGLTSRGLNRSWLEIELEKLGVALENVYLGQVDTYGQLTVDIYDDKIQIPEAKPRQSLLTALKKCQADLETFSLETDSETAKQMYHKNAKKLHSIIEKSEYLLTQKFP